MTFTDRRRTDRFQRRCVGALTDTGRAVYYGVVNALSTPMYANPYQIIVMNAIADYAAGKYRRPGDRAGNLSVDRPLSGHGGDCAVLLDSSGNAVSARRRDLLFLLSDRDGCLRDDLSSPARSAQSAGIGEIGRTVL